MKLDQIILALVILAALAYACLLVVGVVSAGPYGVLILVPFAIFVAILIVVIRQKLANKEDRYYEENVDK